MKCTLSILVDNSAGVLSRVAGLFTRRGYNIDSLTVGVTADPKYSRMTIVTSGEEDTLDQIAKQLRKLEDVLALKILKGESSVQRELILVKVKVAPEKRQELITMVNVFRAGIVDVGTDSLIIEATGNQSKLEAILNLLSTYEILELARTGITGLSRGMDDVTYL